MRINLLGYLVTQFSIKLYILQILMNVLLVMVDVKFIVLTHLGRLSAPVIIMKYLMLLDCSVLVCKAYNSY